jgi:serine/threonine protein kinase
MSAPSAIDISPGSIIRSRKTAYEVRRLLGEGGFGSVYLVNELQDAYALKVTKMWTFMPSERLEYAKRFRQEYEYSSSLNSDFIVRSYDFDTFEGNPFMVLELCEGGSLSDWIGKPLDELKLQRMVAGVLRGLHDLHTEGIIHRDVKPDNILFNRHNTPKLADFGISASVKKRHTVANFMGHAKEVFATGTYSPPEQIDPKQAIKVMGPTNDVYAFGAVMYEVLTCGALPFGTFDDFMKDIQAYERKKKLELWDRDVLARHTTDVRWLRVIERCLRFKPEDRYQSMADIMQDLGYDLNQQYNVVSVTAGSQWVLRVQNGEEIGREYQLTRMSAMLGKQVLTVGWFNEEDPFTNDIGIAELFTQYISGYHATLGYDPVSCYWWIRDGQQRVKNGASGWYPSTNGLLVQGRRVGVDGTMLYPNDIITIGDTTLKVLVHDGGR